MEVNTYSNKLVTLKSSRQILLNKITVLLKYSKLKLASINCDVYKFICITSNSRRMCYKARVCLQCTYTYNIRIINLFDLVALFLDVLAYLENAPGVERAVYLFGKALVLLELRVRGRGSM